MKKRERNLDLVKIREKKRRLASNMLDGLEDYTLNKIISKIDIIECIKCGQPFVSDHTTNVRRCAECGPGDSYYYNMMSFVSSNKKKAKAHV